MGHRVSTAGGATRGMHIGYPVLDVTVALPSSTAKRLSGDTCAIPYLALGSLRRTLVSVAGHAAAGGRVSADTQLTSRVVYIADEPVGRLECVGRNAYQAGIVSTRTWGGGVDNHIAVYFRVKRPGSADGVIEGESRCRGRNSPLCCSPEDLINRQEAGWHRDDRIGRDFHGNAIDSNRAAGQDIPGSGQGKVLYRPNERETLIGVQDRGGRLCDRCMAENREERYDRKSAGYS